MSSPLLYKVKSRQLPGGKLVYRAQFEHYTDAINYAYELSVGRLVDHRAIGVYYPDGKIGIKYRRGKHII